MARRGTVKRRSRDQEDFVASQYGGRVSPSSGARPYDLGDVSFDGNLVECKCTGDPVTPKQSFSLKVAEFEKIADEAWSLGRTPMMAIRIYNDGSVLAGNKGYIDLVVRLMADDVALFDKGE